MCIESPLAGDRVRNVAYALAALRDSIDRGEAPFAGHLLYTHILDDALPEQREIGMDCHLSWLRHASLVAVYADYGVSPGMRWAINLAVDQAIPIEYRRILRGAA